MALPTGQATIRGKQFGKSFGKQLGPPPSTTTSSSGGGGGGGGGGKSVLSLSSIAASQGTTATTTATGTTTTTTNTITGDGDGDGDDADGSSKILPLPKRKLVVRQASLFASLDEAENMALDLLTLASNTAQFLADVNGTSGTNADKNKITRNNGKEYLEKVNNIHTLLKPHAHLVLAYRNHSVDTRKKHQAEENNDKNNKENPKEEVDSSSNPKNEVDASSNNMYAARVELRLALERRDVLNESLRLEKEMIQQSQQQLDLTSTKRKRED